MQMLAGSGATFLQGVPARLELGADDAPLGAISIEAHGVGPQPGKQPHAWWCGASIPARLGKQPRFTRPNPQILKCHGSGGRRTASAGLARFFVPACQLGACGEQCKASMFVGRSHKKQWRSTGSCTQFGLVLKKVESLHVRFWLPSNSLVPPCFCLCSSYHVVLLACPHPRRR
jgi:hypothetical protein